MPFQAALRRARLYAPQLVAALLALAMSFSLALEIRDWLQLQQMPTPASAATGQTAPRPLDLEHLEPLFGPAATAGTNGPPPATNLGITLLGSFVHVDPQRSSAIIQLSGGKPRRYRIGEEIQAGIRLHAVYRERVELERNGRLENLSFPSLGKGTRNAPTAEVTTPLESPADSADADEDAPE